MEPNGNHDSGYAASNLEESPFPVAEISQISPMPSLLHPVSWKVWEEEIHYHTLTISSSRVSIFPYFVGRGLFKLFGNLGEIIFSPLRLSVQEKVLAADRLLRENNNNGIHNLHPVTIGLGSQAHPFAFLSLPDKTLYFLSYRLCLLLSPQCRVNI